jgi:hypothetical protein
LAGQFGSLNEGKTSVLHCPGDCRTPPSFSYSQPPRPFLSDSDFPSSLILIAMRVGNWAKVVAGARSRRIRYKKIARIGSQVSRLTRMIETKSGVWVTASNVALPHYKLHVIQAPGSGSLYMNCLQTGQGVTDPTGATQMNNHIGDKITVNGVLFSGMFENALNRPKVFYHFMLLNCARGDIPDVDKLYQRNSNNELVDLINTERYTIVAQKKFTISLSNSAPSLANDPTGAPEESTYTDTKNAGMGTKLFKLWVPGSKFGRGGNVTYEQNGMLTKFFDYVPVRMTYDWFRTPSGDLLTNNVGRINTLFCKLYFKDA